MRAGLLLLLLVACAKDAPNPPSPLVVRSKAIADKLCACRDADCVRAIEIEWNAIANETNNLTADDVEVLAAEAKRVSTCVEELKRKGAR